MTPALSSSRSSKIRRDFFFFNVSVVDFPSSFRALLPQRRQSEISTQHAPRCMHMVVGLKTKTCADNDDISVSVPSRLTSEKPSGSAKGRNDLSNEKWAAAHNVGEDADAAAHNLGGDAKDSAADNLGEDANAAATKEKEKKTGDVPRSQNSKNEKINEGDDDIGRIIEERRNIAK